MPAKSKAQQRFMGMVHAYKKGELKGSEVSKAIKKAAKGMKKKTAKDYASTKHTDKPERVKSEAKERDYKAEYKKFQSSTKSKKYRAELNKYNRQKGTYGNGDGKDASHKGGKIAGFEKESTNRGRREKSRLKKETVNEGFEKYHLGNVGDSKLKNRLERAIKIWGGKVDAVGMDTIKFRLSSSDVMKFPALLKKLDRNKNVWIGDKRKNNVYDRKQNINKLGEAISKDEWAQYPKYARKLKPYLQKLFKVPIKVRVIKQANHNPWIEVRVARFGKDIIPNDFRKKAAKVIGASGVRDWDNVNYGNIRVNSISLKADDWKKLLGNKVKSESVNEIMAGSQIPKTPTKKLVKIYKQMADERLSSGAALIFRMIAKELIKRKAKLEGSKDCCGNCKKGKECCSVESINEGRKVYQFHWANGDTSAIKFDKKHAIKSLNKWLSGKNGRGWKFIKIMKNGKQVDVVFEKDTYPISDFNESVNEATDWMLKLDIGKNNPNDFKKWASPQMQRKHKIKVRGGGKKWIIVGGYAKNGSSMDWIKGLLDKAWRINKIKTQQIESVNEAKEIKFHQIQPKDYIWYRGGIQYFVTKTGPNVLHMGLVNKGKPGSGGSLFASNTKLTRKNFDSQIRVKFIKKITRGQNTLWQESVNEGKKRFKVGFNIGKAKYVISHHDGRQKHKDGSDFFGISIYKNKKAFEKGQEDLRKKGYIEESVNEATEYYKSKRKSDDLFYKKVGNKWYKSLANKKGKVGWYVVKFPRDLDKKDMNKINKTKLPSVLRESVNEAKTPRKALDANKVKNSDDFWKVPISKINKVARTSFGRQTEVGDVILWMNFAIDAWNKGRVSESVNEAKSANNKNIKKKMDSGEWKVIGHSKKKGKSTLHIRDKSGKRFDLKVNEAKKYDTYTIIRKYSPTSKAYKIYVQTSHRLLRQHKINIMKQRSPENWEIWGHDGPDFYGPNKKGAKLVFSGATNEVKLMKLTKTQLREMIKQELNEISDAKNPEYMFNTMDTSLVVGIANKKIDAVKYAKKQLAGRGFDKRGKWVGFEKAKKIHRV